MPILYKITATKDGKTMNASVTKELVNDAMEMHNINTLEEIKDVLRLGMILEAKVAHAKENNIPCHFDKDFDATKLTTEEFEEFTELFTTYNIINDECEIVVTEIED